MVPVMADLLMDAGRAGARVGQPRGSGSQGGGVVALVGPPDVVRACRGRPGDAGGRDGSDQAAATGSRVGPWVTRSGAP
ncbi:hypothetical protein GCM10011505_29900 [Tistrella bauzanensis]|uniref:Uncharacterized protein n=1 Tax=Tistrella bauzanensis TaxID=657419 RepID=A0ABQ1IND6_9PROT|nr:hypothetical protein GCM10011505_29900 [Tistrella bauzanensis]